MPLTSMQRRVIAVLRPFRSAHDYVAGGAALNQRWMRLSDDMDIFLDRRDRLPAGVECEVQALREAGFAVEITTRDAWMVEAIVREFGFATQVQWLDDPETSRRFLPALEDAELGFKLNQADLAVNKVLCAARRNEVRDAVDLLSIARHYCALGALAWAAAGKERDGNPLRLIPDIRSRAFGFADEEVRAVHMEASHAVSRAEMREGLGQALDEAYAYCEERAPADYAGHLFVDSEGRPIDADAAALAAGAAFPLPLKDFAALPRVANP
jgi:hypothetical protein